MIQDELFLPKACEMVDRAAEIEQQFTRGALYQEGTLIN